MALAHYYLGTVDINIYMDRTKDEIVADAPELFGVVSAPIGSVYDGKKINLMMTAFRRREPRKNSTDNLLCSNHLIELLKEVQGEPDLLEKIIAVTEAHRALNQ